MFRPHALSAAAATLAPAPANPAAPPAGEAPRRRPPTTLVSGRRRDASTRHGPGPGAHTRHAAWGLSRHATRLVISTLAALSLAAAVATGQTPSASAYGTVKMSFEELQKLTDVEDVTSLDITIFDFSFLKTQGFSVYALKESGELLVWDNFLSGLSTNGVDTWTVVVDLLNTVECPQKMIRADIDSDSDRDLIVLGGTGEIGVHRLDTSSKIAALEPLEFVEALDPELMFECIASTDIDGDDDNDIVVTATRLGKVNEAVTVNIMNGGDGAFAAGEETALPLAPPSPLGLYHIEPLGNNIILAHESGEIGDGDSDAEVVVVEYVLTSQQWMIAQDVALESDVPIVGIPGIDLGDIDGDGNDDLIVGVDASDDYVVLTFDISALNELSLADTIELQMPDGFLGFTKDFELADWDFDLDLDLQWRFSQGVFLMNETGGTQVIGLANDVTDVAFTTATFEEDEVDVPVMLTSYNFNLATATPVATPNVDGPTIYTGDSRVADLYDSSFASVDRLVATADFNGDGAEDLIFASDEDDSGSADTISWQANLSTDPFDITFDEKVEFEFGGIILEALGVDATSASGEAPAGAFDRIAVAVSGSTGAFEPIILLSFENDNTLESLPFDPGGFGAMHGVRIGDLDLDGDHDLAAVQEGQGGDTLRVFLNNADGTFSEPPVFNGLGGFGGSSDADVRIVDLLGDATPEILFYGVGAVGAPKIVRSNGGSFDPDEFFPAGADPVAIAAGDLNGDGAPDLAVANGEYTGSIAILLNNRDATFAAPASFPAGSNPEALAVADLDGDGALDVAVANSVFGGGTVDVLLGAGDGTFAPATSFPVAGGAEAMVVADLNGDDVPDVATANVFDSNVSVLLGAGDGTLNPQATFAVGSTPKSIATIDLNEDGAPDLVTANQFGDTISILSNNGDGTFAPQVTVPSGGSQPIALDVGDLNDDDLPDVAVANVGFPGGIGVLLNNGDGTLAAPGTLIDGAQNADALSIADVDGDGARDIVTTSDLGVNDDGVSVFRNDGDATFLPPLILGDGFGSSDSVIEDLNADGKLDIAVANRIDDNVGVLLQNDDVFFSAVQSVGDPEDFDQVVKGIAAGDVDGDGLNDVVYTVNENQGQGVSEVRIFLNEGEGFPDTFTALDAGPSPRGIALVDTDGDEDLDMLVTNATGGPTEARTVSLLRNDGGGGFGEPEDRLAFPVLSNPQALLPAQMDGAGGMDVVVAGSDAGLGFGGVSILTNNFASGPPPCFPDFNDDGALNVFDFVAFQTAFQSGDLAADCNADGNLDVFDFVCFQQAFGAGCG